MPELLRTEKRPLMPVLDCIISHGRPYRVKEGDNWSSISRMECVELWSLIEFNFRTINSDELNWYLREYVGCVRTTADGANWRFSTGLKGGRGAWKGGTIWLPTWRSGRVSNSTNVPALGAGPQTSPPVKTMR